MIYETKYENERYNNFRIFTKISNSVDEFIRTVIRLRFTTSD